MVTIIIINYQTPDLTSKAIGLFRAHYPALPILLVDNGSRDSSHGVLKAIADRDENVELMVNPVNIHHGPAMDQGARRAATPYLLFLDSDAFVKQGGFVEKMQEALDASSNRYAVGLEIFVNARGFEVSAGAAAINYLRPICLLVKRDIYLTLPPFARHGTPCLSNFIAARRSGYELVNFPIEDYIDHEGRGTAGRWGYGLGLRGKWNYLMNRLGF